MKLRLLLAVVSLLSFASLAGAVTLTIGPGFGGSPNSSDVNLGVTRTAIDLGSPASATGTVTAVHFYWSQAGCANAAKVKFFHRSGNTLTMYAERGPFTPSANDYTTAITAVNVTQGDLIGITRLAACGNVGAFVGITSGPYVEYGSDVGVGAVTARAGNLNGLDEPACSAMMLRWIILLDVRL